MFNFFKRNKGSKNDLHDKNGNVVEKSAITYSKHGERFLKLQDDACAIVLHPGNNVEVIFTKLYDSKNQTITSDEESLMALGLFMKQPGFLQMLVQEFHRIAMERISTLTDNSQNNEGKK